MTDFTPSTETGLNIARHTATVEKNTAFPSGLPKKQGLYDPRNEHDACGVGFVAHMKG
jgi:glutamate synthase (NADPH/NADH) large chain